MKSFSDPTSGTFAKFVFKLHSYVRTIGSSHLPTIQNKKLNIQNLRTIPFTPSPLNPLIPRRLPAAFSLTEVVIAMGVAAVAFTSIIALFPLGLAMSKETFETTQAALITQSIMNQILDVQGGTGNTGFRRIIVNTNNDPSNRTNLASFNVGSYNPSTNIVIFYTNYLNPSSGQISWKPGGTANTNDWQNGKINCPALVRVTLRRIFTGGTAYDIHGVEVQVDYPGNAKLTNRTHEVFSRICH